MDEATRMNKILKSALCGTMAASMLVSQTAWAGYVPSTQVLTTQQTEQSRAEVMSLLDRADVQAELEKQGVSPEEAKARLAMLPPGQIDELKTQLDTMPAGEGVVGVVVGALLIVFLILLFTDLLGETDAYDFDD